MIRSDFFVEIANYELDYADLRAVREPVFVLEQQVPAEVELDSLDPHCRHVLARDEVGRAIGTGRITAKGRIGRLGVLIEWRGRGVGEALLQALVDMARSQGLPMVELHAQVDAIGFYERNAFECVGPEFVEAGIRHRNMCRVLDPFPEVSRAALAPRPESKELLIDSLAKAAEFVRQMAEQARRNLWLYSRDLDFRLYGAAETLEALKRFAIRARGGELRILLQDPETALREGHPLIPLSQRLSSRILIRVPQEEQDLQYAAAFFLDDAGGYLWRPLGSRYEGNGNLYAPGKQRQLRDYFEQVWERALPDPRLRQIHL